MLCFVLFLVPLAAFGQTDANSLELSLKGLLLTPRSFSADEVARYRYENGVLQAEPVELHAVGLFETKSVSVKKNVVLIVGELWVMLHEASKGKYTRADHGPMTIRVDLKGANPTDVLPKLREMIFFATTDEALAALPKWLNGTLPFELDQAGEPPKPDHWVRVDGVWVDEGEDGPKVTFGHAGETKAPRVSQDDPYPHGFHARVSLRFIASETGKVEDVWIRRPFAGMDHEAYREAKHHQPLLPMLGNKPVGVSITSDIDFSRP